MQTCGLQIPEMFSQKLNHRRCLYKHWRCFNKHWRCFNKHWRCFNKHRRCFNFWKQVPPFSMRAKDIFPADSRTTWNWKDYGLEEPWRLGNYGLVQLIDIQLLGRQGIVYSIRDSRVNWISTSTCLIARIGLVRHRTVIRFIWWLLGCILSRIATMTHSLCFFLVFWGFSIFFGSFPGLLENHELTKNKPRANRTIRRTKEIYLIIEVSDVNKKVNI